MNHAETWAVVLAAGEGMRLQSLVRLLHGYSMPKQFAVISGGQSLLQATVARIGTLIPPWRTLVVVSVDFASLAREQLAAWPGVELVVQPRNLGTAPGILLPLAILRARAPHARVAIFPSDHYVANVAPFLDGVRTAAAHSAVTLLGIDAERPEIELGWIVPERPFTEGVETVARFVEKPHLALAAELWRRGALWNSFVTVGDVQAIWELAAARLPEHAAAFASAHQPDAVRAIYQRVEPADFCRAVLERSEGLQVARVAGSGWADWGTPERVIDSLEGTPALVPLLRRMLDGHLHGRAAPMPLAARLVEALHHAA